MSYRIGICIHERWPGQISCAARGSRLLLAAVQAGCKARPELIDVFGLACLGECERGIAVKIVGGDVLTGILPDGADKVLAALEDAG